MTNHQEKQVEPQVDIADVGAEGEAGVGQGSQVGKTTSLSFDPHSIDGEDAIRLEDCAMLLGHGLETVRRAAKRRGFGDNTNAVMSLRLGEITHLRARWPRRPRHFANPENARKAHRKVNGHLNDERRATYSK